MFVFAGGSFSNGPVAGVTINMITLPVTAPAAGFLRVSVSGYCNITGGAASTQYELAINMVSATSPACCMASAFNTVPASTTYQQVPFATQRVVAVGAGLTTLYAIQHTYAIGSGYDCSGTMTAFWSPTQLP
jgi:hypothetical protein